MGGAGKGRIKEMGHEGEGNHRQEGTVGLIQYHIVHQTCHNFVGRIRIFSVKIRINLYHFNIPHAKHSI